jgi:predicted nucleic acid-binding protein
MRGGPTRKQVIVMSAGIVVAIIVAVVVIAAIVIGLTAASRRRRLQQRFGPEYDRLVGEHESKRKAEAELTERERRVQELDLRPLTDSARAGYAHQWANLQEQFVDTPVAAVGASQLLVVAVMSERGYPVESRDQVLADLSVDHASTLDRYRAAEKISTAANAGTASTEDLRQAMIHYRVLFRELLGEAADTTGSNRVASDTRPYETRTSAADESVSNRQSDIPVQRTPRS